MPSRRLGLALIAYVLFVHTADARTRAIQHPGWPLGAPPVDQFTTSNTAEVTTMHLALDLTVDFDQHQLRGSATLHLNNMTGTRSLRLDADNLAITKITLDGTTPTTWVDNHPGLEIVITPTTETVTIEYSTSANGNGLFWHAADETFGGVQPFLYTQNEPTDARFWIPIQDTPA